MLSAPGEFRRSPPCITRTDASDLQKPSYGVSGQHGSGSVLLWVGRRSAFLQELVTSDLRFEELVPKLRSPALRLRARSRRIEGRAAESDGTGLHLPLKMNQGGESMFSMKGVFGALKKTVKDMVRAKFHELTDDTRQSYKAPASAQHYAEPVSSSSVDLEPSNEELSDVAKAASKLWDLDINRLTPGKDYAIDVGDGTKVYGKEDQADAALFRNLDQSVFQRATYARFYALLDNYNSSEHVAEQRSSQEENEEIAFIEEISRTAPIKYIHKYLQAKNIIKGDEEQFKNALRSLWFDLYNRGGTRGSSSAFEHVFVGEVKRDRNSGESEVSGLHNWIQFYVEEAKGRLDYQGFILPRRRGDPSPDSESQLLTVQFKWNGVLKAVSSTLIGVSPEFEIALYTLCFFCGAEDNHVTLGPYYVNVKVYPLGNNCIGSAFPIADE